MAKKYSLSIPDPSMFGMKLSGVNPNKNVFKISGEVLLKIDRGGIISYTVVSSDFKNSFPLGFIYWSTTHMFCTGMNHNLTIYTNDPWWTLEASLLRQRNNFVIFSKHKVDDDHWRVIIYDDEDLFYPHADLIIDEGNLKQDFYV